jgi:hypothetical protein
MKIFIFNFEDNFDKKLIQHFQLKSHFPLLDWNVYFPKDLCEIVRDPSSADYIIFSGNLPCAINNLSLFHLLVLFYNCELFHKYYWKFIFIYDDDNSWRIPMGGTWLRVSIDKQLSSSESISIPYLLKKQVFQRTDNCSLPANFVGALHTHPIRDRLAEYVSDKNYFTKFFLILRKEFYGHPGLGEPEKKKRKYQLNEAIKKSFITFCPRGTGMNSVRFFEAMSLGRIPILISEHCDLPFKEDINYDEFSFNVSYSGFDNISEILDAESEKLKKMCKIAHKIHQEYFSLTNYPRKLVDYLQRKKEQIYESRKREDIFHCKLEIDHIYNYCLDYLIKHQKDNEVVNVYTMATNLMKMTTDAREKESVKNILDNISVTNTNTTYENNLRKYIFTEYGIELSTEIEFNKMIDLYFEKTFKRR